MTNYTALYNSMEVKPSARAGALKVCTNHILPNKARYQAVAKTTGVPWWWIAAVHHMESSSNFGTHLHNGDSLSDRTHHVPSGRPIEGNPPFTWEFSANDALDGDAIVHDQKTWKLENALWLFEVYNGKGYERHNINSPYVWSGCQHYVKGLYVSDGLWDGDSVSQQIGAAVIVNTLETMGEVLFPEAIPAIEIVKVVTNLGENIMTDAPAPVRATVPISSVTVSLLPNILKYLQGPIGALIMAQVIDPTSIVNTLAHQNFWLGMLVTIAGGILQHTAASTSNDNTLSALGIPQPVATPKS